jgi:CRISPR-associated endonuclease/helicase Cas3
MKHEPDLDFERTFHALTGNPPFPWQRALYERFAAGQIPTSCNLPTGLGKTSVVAVALIALANFPDRMPRQIAYVVNRRTVVDQTTVEVEKLRVNLVAAGLQNRLRALCANPEEPMPLAISTLRGQFADNGEWRSDPTRPAVIVGTVDMIGSRLLFSGYGCGFKTRPLHAGLLGQDTLLVHDEAHLEPAFQKLLIQIRAEQSRGGDLRPLRIMELTATSRSEADGEAPFSLTDDDYKNPIVAGRIDAVKKIVLYALDDEKKTVDLVSKLALEHLPSERAILVFLRRVEDVAKVRAQLKKKADQVEQLTGTLRGWERDQLAKSNPVLARFLPPSNRTARVDPAPGTVFLVCTSAGEVGVNISADHAVCDLSTFESMTQRFGRVNRFGACPDTQIDVVYPIALPTEDAVAEEQAKDPGKQNTSVFVDAARRRTLELLHALRGDGSPRALGQLKAEDRQAAFSPSPAMVDATDVLFDAWALTTIRDRLPGRPPVADWLHGVADWEPPETHVAWREEVSYLMGVLTPEQLEDALEDYPLKPHEVLRDRTARVFGHLETLAARHAEAMSWLVGSDNRIQTLLLTDLVEKDRQNKPLRDLAGCTVILPPTVGGLSSGMLDGSALYVPESHSDYDIADRWFDDADPPRPRRVRVWDDDVPPPGFKWRLARTIDVRPDAEDELEELASEDATPPRRIWRWFVRPQVADDGGSKWASKPQELRSHLETAEGHATRLVAALNLSPPLASAVVLASAWHDLGKNRALWQASIGNRHYPELVLAKSDGRMRPIDLNRFRHEFGSLLDALRDHAAALDGQSDEVRDLIMHLIAAHHGRARPHFPNDEAFDPNHPEQHAKKLAVEVPQRFARLQRRYGRWGLAWLESLVRAADALASQTNVEVNP